MCRRRGHLVSAVTAGHTAWGAPNSHSEDRGAQECSAGSLPKGLILLGKLPYRRNGLQQKQDVVIVPLAL